MSEHHMLKGRDSRTMKSTTGSKYTSVRITTAQFEKLQEMGKPFGTSVNALVQIGVDNLLHDEAPIWADKAKDILAKRRKK